MKAAAAISIVLVTLTVCVLLTLHVMRREAGQTARGAMDLARQVLHLTPETTITSYVSRQKTEELLELASISKQFPVSYSFQQTWLGSTKSLDLLGDYTVKAGFDLRERFSLQVDEKTRRVQADFPAPKILSIQQNGYQVTRDADGLWNKLSQKDQEQGVREMNGRARAAALEMKILDEARSALRQQFEALAREAGQEWTITFREAAPAVVP